MSETPRYDADDNEGSAIARPRGSAPPTPLELLEAKPPGVIDSREGITLVAFARIVQGLNQTRARYVMYGVWGPQPVVYGGLGWEGAILIPKEVRAASDTFDVLAAVGYAPCPPMSPYDLASWPPRSRRFDEDDDDDEYGCEEGDEVAEDEDAGDFDAKQVGDAGIDAEGRYRRLAFVSKATPASPIWVAVCETQYFEDWWEAAEVDELEFALPAIMLNPMNTGEMGNLPPQYLSEMKELDERSYELEWDQWYREELYPRGGGGGFDPEL